MTIVKEKKTASKYDVKDSTLQKDLSDLAELIDFELDKLLPKNSPNLARAMRYSCIELKGKKLRPFLFTETLKVLGMAVSKQMISIAAVLELIHVYSLIHDDLPAIDNDDFRRGSASCHKKFGEATAILAGDALLTYAFEIISSCDQIPPQQRLALILELAKAIGFNGMIKGQYEDIENKNKKTSAEDILTIHRLKTGKLMVFSCEAAAIIANCSQEAKNALKFFAEDFGLIFQIADDILDFKTNSKTSECNIVTEIGVVKAKELVDDLAKKALSSLEVFGTKANTLKALVSTILK